MGRASAAGGFAREARSKRTRRDAVCCSLWRRVIAIKIYMHQESVHKAKFCSVKRTLGKAALESGITNLVGIRNRLKRFNAFAYTAN